jgi:hypothetical protein
MASLADIEFHVYDRRMQRTGVLGSPRSVTGSFMRHRPGSFQFVVSATDPMLEDIFRKGARVGITYRGVDEFSGMRRNVTGSLTASGDVQFTVQGDRRLLDNHLAWIDPQGPVFPTSLDPLTPAGRGQSNLPIPALSAGAGTVDGQTGYVQWPDGSIPDGRYVAETAESAIKWILEQNLINRLGKRVRIAPDLKRGGDPVFPNVRMATLSEAIQPILNESGLRVTMIQHPNDEFITIDVEESDEYGPALTAASGVVGGGTWSLNPPTTTRAMVGGPGDIAERMFWEVRDQNGLEDEYGDSIEVFRDATGANLQWPSSLADAFRVAKYYLLRPEVAEDGLEDGAPTTSVAAELSESGEFAYGGPDGVRLGTRCRVQAANEQVYADVIGEAKLNYGPDGLSVVPVLGSITDDPNRKTAEAIMRLATSQRKIQRSKSWP